MSKRPPHKKSQRRKPHTRTVHEMDPRNVAYQSLRRMKPGDMVEPTVLKTLRYLGYNESNSRRVIPMVEDASRFSLMFDYLISHVASRKPSELDDDVRAALHLFLAWYLLGDPGSPYAHGNAAVNLLSATHKGRGFTNAIVRRLGEMFSVEKAEPEDFRGMAERTEAPPLFRNKARISASAWVVAKRDVFPHPEADLAGHLAVTCGMPKDFVTTMLEQHGPQAATHVAVASVYKPPVWVRPNALLEDNDLANWWKQKGVEFETVAVEGSVDALVLPVGTKGIIDHPAFKKGGFYIQDYSAQRVAPTLQAKAGQKLLDLCSAPGGKAAHLCELTGDKAAILACDLTDPKMEKIQENIVRMGYKSIATVQADATEVKFPEPFDGIIIDAPCTNSGVLARRVEARHRITETNLKSLIKTQTAILENAARNLKAGGSIVYSVCSLLMEEGVDVVYKFLRGLDDNVRREDAGWKVTHEHHILPVPGWHDGGYAARITKPI
ncbi:MAG: methyltransferase domain-containing protein [Planctomycetota bacterium]